MGDRSVFRSTADSVGALHLLLWCILLVLYMQAVRKHGKQTKDLHVQELMQRAVATLKRAMILSHNTVKFEISVHRTCCEQVYVEVDTDIISTDGSRGLGGKGEFADRLRNLVASGHSAEAEVVRVSF